MEITKELEKAIFQEATRAIEGAERLINSGEYSTEVKTLFDKHFELVLKDNNLYEESEIKLKEIKGFYSRLICLIIHGARTKKNDNEFSSILRKYAPNARLKTYIELREVFYELAKCATDLTFYPKGHDIYETVDGIFRNIIEKLKSRYSDRIPKKYKVIFEEFCTDSMVFHLNHLKELYCLYDNKELLQAS